MPVEFNNHLEDYDIERPKLVVLKVGKQINIRLQFRAFHVETSQAIELPAIFLDEKK